MTRVVRQLLPALAYGCFAYLGTACDAQPAEESPKARTNKATIKTPTPEARPMRERPSFALSQSPTAAELFGDTLSDEARLRLDLLAPDRAAALRLTRYCPQTLPTPPGFELDTAKASELRKLHIHLKQLRDSSTGRGGTVGAGDTVSEAAVDAYITQLRDGAEHRTAELFIDLRLMQASMKQEKTAESGWELEKINKRYGGLIAKHHTPDNLEEDGCLHPQTMENALRILEFMVQERGHGPSTTRSLAYLDERFDLLATATFLQLLAYDEGVLEQLAQAPVEALQSAAKLHWQDGDDSYFVFEQRSRKTLMRNADGAQVLDASSARAAFNRHLQAQIAETKGRQRSAMATMHYADGVDMIVAKQVVYVEDAEVQRLHVGRPASASHALTDFMAKRGRIQTPYFLHEGLSLAPGMHAMATKWIAELKQAYPKSGLTEPPAMPKPDVDPPANDEAPAENPT